MSSLADRAALFGSDDFLFDRSASLFIWAGTADPFSRDEIGLRLMRFLVMVAGWEGDELAESLFSAIAVLTVKILKESRDALSDTLQSGSFHCNSPSSVATSRDRT